MQDVFIVGCKGIPASYGGFETFVEQLVRNRQNDEIRYHVACAADELPEQAEFEYEGAHGYCIKWRPIGSARAIAYDLDALDWAIRYAKEHNCEKPIFYVLACRVGPFIKKYARQIHELGGVLYVNPDGHEWMRAKWSAPVRKYWKFSEAGMVKHADLLICDSKNIESYIRDEYKRFNPSTAFIPYGADLKKSELADDDSVLLNWFRDKDLMPNGYYLIVGRFVPENNYETMIREFMITSSPRSLALITSTDEAFLDELNERTHFRDDTRIKFVGTVYDHELLKKIRENAFAYLHGHEVGGTNPSLLEGLASTRLSLLLDVGFNREVAESAALYWNKEKGSLSSLIEHAETLNSREVEAFDKLSLARIEDAYSWDLICRKYESLFHPSI